MGAYCTLRNETRNETKRNEKRIETRNETKGNILISKEKIITNYINNYYFI